MKITLAAYEADIRNRAEYYTAVRGFGGNRTRAEFKTLNEARAAAAAFGDGRTMIYAVAGNGQQVFIQKA